MLRFPNYSCENVQRISILITKTSPQEWSRWTPQDCLTFEFFAEVISMQRYETTCVHWRISIRSHTGQAKSCGNMKLQTAIIGTFVISCIAWVQGKVKCHISISLQDLFWSRIEPGTRTEIPGRLELGPLKHFQQLLQYFFLLVLFALFYCIRRTPRVIYLLSSRIQAPMRAKEILLFAEHLKFLFQGIRS